MSLAFLQILSIENDCHSVCIAISTEKQRFLIEAGEGTQRLIVEHKVRLGKIASILLTSGQVSSLGGLPGILLTLDDAGVSPIQVVSPPEAQTYIQSTQYFMRSLGNFNIITSQNTLQPIKYDELTITPVLVQCKPSDLVESRICYIGETPSITGKFDIQKAIELKIPKGPLYGKLKNGITVELDDGRTISPDFVVGEATPPQYFAVICRVEEEKDLPNLIQNNVWSNYSSIEKKYFNVMIHLSPSSIISNSLYQNWLLSFPSETQHIFIGKQDSLNNRSTSFLASSLYNSKLFSLFGNNFTPFTPFITTTSTPSTTFNNYHIGENLLKFNLLPIKKKGLIELPYQSLTESLKEELKPFHTESFQSYPYLSNILEIKQNHYHSLLSSKPEITEAYWLYFMGTGCAIPSRYRNVSSFLLYLPSTDSCILLDSGEATWFQLTYLQPPSPTYQPPLEGSNSERWASIIKMVWISHPHADHHLGLINLILKRRQYLPASKFVPLLLIAPINVYSYLRDCCVIYLNLASSFVFIPCNYFDPTETCTSCITTVNNSLLSRASPIVPPIADNVIANPSFSRGENTEFAQQDIEDVKAAKRPRSMFLSYSTYYQQFLSSDQSDSLLFLRKMLDEIGIESLSNIPVIHCRQSYGLILTASTDNIHHGTQPTKSMKLVYSGDTRPCDQLVFHGKDADILIHEATFEDEKYIEAVNKKHSTISEAMEVGKLMNCSSIILTHFSQRYHGVPLQFHPKGANPIELIEQKMKEQQEQNRRVLLPIIAFDFMMISNLDLPWLPYLTHPIAEIFAKDELREEEELEKGEVKG